MATYSFCTLTITALLLVSMQNVTQFKVKDRTSGTLFFVAVLISATIYMIRTSGRIYDKINPRRKLWGNRDIPLLQVNIFYCPHFDWERRLYVQMDLIAHIILVNFTRDENAALR